MHATFSTGHPLTEAVALPVAPVVLAVGGVIALASTAAFTRPRPATSQVAGRSRSGQPTSGDRSFHSWEMPLRGVRIATRAAGVGVLLLAVVAGRLGTTSRFHNIAPALVVGVAWPGLLIASAALGRVWAWLDPWDTLGRLLEGRMRDHAGGADFLADVRPAALVALGWMWLLSASLTTLNPRTVGGALGLYTILTLSGCLIVGHARWLGSAEFFGLIFGWTARLRHGALRTWEPPRGTTFVLGIVAGGLVFAALRRSALWEIPERSPNLILTRSAGLLLFAGAAVLLLVRADRWAAARGSPGVIPAAVVPAVTGLAVAAALVEDQLWLAMQLVIARASDPLGFGWDLLGTAGFPTRPIPFGVGGRVSGQLVALLLGHLIGVVVASRVSAAARAPALATLTLLLAASTVAFTTI